MTFDLGAGRHLVLAGGGRAALWLGLGAVALALLVVLYRYELKLVSRRVGRTLLGLRLLVALALVAALFEPIAERRVREPLRGRVILGVDLSESMTTSDVDAHPNGDNPRVSPNEPRPTISRKEAARRLLAGDWMRNVAANRDVDALGFARDPVASTPAALAEILRKPDRPDDPARLVTDWNPVFDAALKGDDGAPVLGVVLLTDGRQNATGDAARGAERLAARGIAVYPVLIGSTNAPRDVAIADVKVPASVLTGDVARVEATVKADGYPGVEIPVTLARAGAPTLTQVVTGRADGARSVVVFRVPTEATTPRNLTVAVGPLPGDVRPDNDRRDVAIQVADDKVKILLVDAEPRWEFRYVRNALARDPAVDVESVVFRQPPAGDRGGVRTYKDALPTRARPEDADPLNAFDVIVVGDVDPSTLPEDAWRRLDRFVAERGGTLILSFGPRAWTSGTLALEAVRTLLPVLAPRPAPSARTSSDATHPSLTPGFAIAPGAATTSASTILELGGDAARSRGIWADLPRLPWVLVGRAKPAAAVLATLVERAHGGARPNNDAVIAAQPYGLGKVLWLGTDATWRWRFRVGDLYHHRFWGQAARWAAQGKLAAGDDLIRFGPDRPRVPADEGVRLEARFDERVRGVGPELLVTARVYDAVAANPQDEARAIVAMSPVPGRPRTFAATTPPLPTGRYVVRLDAPQVADALKSLGGDANAEAKLEVVAPLTSERVELSAARDPLARLASSTGGRVFTPSDADELPALLRGREVVKIRVEETALWDRPWALGLFLAAISVEWIVRKRAGLP